MKSRSYLNWRKSLQLLAENLYVTSRGRYCTQHPGITYLSAEAAHLSLPNCTYGLDVLVRIGYQRDYYHMSFAKIHAHLPAHIEVSERHLPNLYQKYQALLACADRLDVEELKIAASKYGGLILSVDGLQPEGGQQGLWVVREVLTGTLLAAGWLPRDDETRLVQFLSPVKALDLPFLATVSDKQVSLINALKVVWKDIPHQYCQAHYFSNAVGPLYEADEHMKTQMRKQIRKAAGPTMREALAHAKEKKNDGIPELIVTGLVVQPPAGLDEVKAAAEATRTSTMASVTDEPVVASMALTDQPVVASTTLTDEPAVTSTALTDQPPVALTTLTDEPVVASRALTDQPAVVSTTLTDQPVVASTALTDQPVVASTVLTDQPAVASTTLTDQPVVASTAPTDQPPVASTTLIDQPVVASAALTDQPPVASTVLADVSAIGSTALSDVAVIGSTALSDVAAVGSTALSDMPNIPLQVATDSSTVDLQTQLAGTTGTTSVGQATVKNTTPQTVADIRTLLQGSGVLVYERNSSRLSGVSLEAQEPATVNRQQAIDSIVEAYAARLRRVLSRSGRKPFRLAGLRLYADLLLLLESLEVTLSHLPNESRLTCFADSIRDGLKSYEYQYTSIAEGYSWVLDISDILDVPLPEPGQQPPVALSSTIETQVDAYLKQLSKRSDLNHFLLSFRKHLQALTKRYGEGLFHCYDIAGLPRTNNDIESLFGRVRRQTLLTSGPHHAKQRLHEQGAWLLFDVVTNEHEQLKRLKRVSLEEWDKERQRMLAHQATFTANRRFCRHPEKYLAELEAQAAEIARRSRQS